MEFELIKTPPPLPKRGIVIRESLPLQVRHDYVKLSKFNPIRGPYEGWGPVAVKPGRCGMWTSTYTPDNEEGICEWVRWMKSEMPEWMWGWRWAYVYEIASPLRIIEIDSLDDLTALNDEFGDEDQYLKAAGLGQRYPSWERLAKEFDAVHLTEAGQWATRMTRPDTLYGWDCESTLWLRLRKRTMHFVKKVNTCIGGRRPTKQDMRDKIQIHRFRMREMMENMKAWRSAAGLAVPPALEGDAQ
jgi:hypothetical protein